MAEGGSKRRNRCACNWRAARIPSPACLCSRSTCFHRPGYRAVYAVLSVFAAHPGCVSSAGCRSSGPARPAASPCQSTIQRTHAGMGCEASHIITPLPAQESGPAAQAGASAIWSRWAQPDVLPLVCASVTIAFMAMSWGCGKIVSTFAASSPTPIAKARG